MVSAHACGPVRDALLFLIGAARVGSERPSEATEVAASSSEALLRPERLRRRVEFAACYRRGQRRHGRWLSLHSLHREQGVARLGITVSRKVGGAVQRQKLKRRIREIFRRWDKRRKLPSMDIVVHAKPGAAQVKFNELEGELRRLLSGLLEHAERAGK